VAFLDEDEQLGVAPPEEPERPPRRFGPERQRQQFLVRRMIAVGLGIAFLILLVVGVRGCLEARSDRGLRNYAQDISTIMQESEQRGQEFFGSFEDSSLTEQQLEERIRSSRSASSSLLDRAENVDTPDQMRDAQSATTLSLRLRRDALEVMAAAIGDATADAERAESIEEITRQMGSLYASDVLWAQLASPEITAVLEEEDVDGTEPPAGNFMPAGDETKYLDQTEVVGLLTGVGGDEVEAGEHGLGLVQTMVGDTTLSPDETTTVADDASEVAVEVQNQGTAEETGVVVSVTIGGEEQQVDIPVLEAGATEVANVPLTTKPQPGTETTVEILVEPVPGESVSENNEASYTVIFGSTTG
jgi:hypothetical protein